MAIERRQLNGEECAALGRTYDLMTAYAHRDLDRLGDLVVEGADKAQATILAAVTVASQLADYIAAELMDGSPPDLARRGVVSLMVSRALDITPQEAMQMLSMEAATPP